MGLVDGFGGGFEAVAAGDGGDFEVEGGVLGVGAIVDHLFGGGVLGADFDELGSGGVVLAEVGTEAALTVVNLQHDGLLLRGLFG